MMNTNTLNGIGFVFQRSVGLKFIFGAILLLSLVAIVLLYTSLTLTNTSLLRSHECTLPNIDDIIHMAIVYTWVNGSLPCYQSLRSTHGGPTAVGGSRDRSTIGELQYSFRSLEKFLPWHKGPIYIVSPGHIPSWLSIPHPRVTVVNQDDVFPPRTHKFLPTFNTNALEQFLYRIPGLTPMYMQLNDDYIFTSPVRPHDFFDCDGGVKVLLEAGVISRQVPKRKPGIWLSSVYKTQSALDSVFGSASSRRFLKHAPFIFHKAAFIRMHQIFSKELSESLIHKFRHKDDMNIPLLYYYYVIHQGANELRNLKFSIPRAAELKKFKLLVMKDTNVDTAQQVFNTVLNNEEGQHSIKVLALNDQYTLPIVGKRAKEFLQKFLPERSTEFESLIQNPILSIRNTTTCVTNTSVLAPVDLINETAAAVEIEFAAPSRNPVYAIEYLIKGICLGIGFTFITKRLRKQKQQQTLLKTKNVIL